MAHLAYAVIGAAYLWPWNVMLAAGPLVFKQLEGYPGLQANYSSSVMTANTVVNIVVTIYLASRPTNFANRVTYGLLVTGAVFLVLALSCIIELSPPVRFTLILGLVAANTIGVSVVQNGILAIAQRITGGAHMRSLLIGQSVAGVVPPILSLAVGSTTISPAFIGLLFLSATALALLAIRLFRRDNMVEHIALSQGEGQKLPPWDVLKRMNNDMYYPALAIILGFGITLSYPVFANNVSSSNTPLTIFAPLTHLVWNVGDLLGRVMCQYRPNLTIKSEKLLLPYAWSRGIFVILLIFLARAGNPVDLVYELLQFLFGITNGHLITSAVSVARDCVEEALHSAAGGLIGFYIAVGLLLGSLGSFVTISLL